jgi:hypothetical protein
MRVVKLGASAILIGSAFVALLLVALFNAGN